MNESASAASSAKTPAAAPPPKKSGAKRWAIKWLVIYPLLLAAAAGGAFYAAYQQPKLRPYLQPHLQNIIERAPFLRRFVDSPSADKTTDSAQFSQSSQFPQSSQSSQSSTAPAFSDSAPEVAESQTESQTESQINAPPESPEIAPADSVRAEYVDAELARLKNQIAAMRDARRADSQNTEIRLGLIDLRLRTDGDTAAAARALSAVSPVRDSDGAWLAAEVSRLQNAPARDRIADVLRRLLHFVERDGGAVSENESAAAEAWDSRAAAELKKIFNVRRVSGDNEKGESHLMLLRRMETLLLTGQREAYLAALDALAVNPPQSDDANVRVLIDTLREFGMPVYALSGRGR